LVETPASSLNKEDCGEPTFQPAKEIIADEDVTLPVCTPVSHIYYSIEHNALCKAAFTQATVGCQVVTGSCHATGSYRNFQPQDTK
jgi:hypothetical protein